MKKLLLLLAAVIIILPGCADYTDEFNDIDNRLDKLEFVAIPSVEQQMASITESIASLEEVDAKLKESIKALEDSDKATAEEITALKNADKAIEEKIETLKKYVDESLQSTKDWVNATFATLEQYGDLAKEVADVKSLVEAYKNEASQALTTAINALDTSLKSWVGEQLSGYYTIAEVDAKVTELQKTITDGDSALKQQLNELSSQLTATKNDITEAYKTAIKEAIETNNGVINTKIANEIATVNQRITNEVATINAKIVAIEARLDNVEAQLKDLLARIQSISYIPTYSDGKATVVYEDMTGKVTLDFEVSPKDAVAELAKVWESAVSVKAIYTQTRAVSFIDMPITNFEADEANGVFSVTVSADNLSGDFVVGLQEASARLAISDGNNSITSEYIPLFSSIDEELTVFDVDYRSISIHVNWPEDKVAPGNVLKWAYADYAMYNYNGGSGSEWYMLNLHDVVYHNYFSSDKFFYINEENSYVSYEGEKLQLYYTPVAGQPGYFMMGEYAYTTDPGQYYVPSERGPGYYNPCFGPNVIGGYFRKEFIESKKPEVMQAYPEVTLNLTPRGTGTITITPTSDIYMYAYALIEDSVYYGDIMPVLGNKTEYIQWFISSETGCSLLSGNAAYEPTTLIAENFYYLKRNTTYHLCITSYSDKVGSRQSYKEITFQLPEPTLPNPTCVVTPAELPAGTPESEKPYLIAFNIKCPTKDADEVRYVANYERNWESQRSSLKKSGYTTEEADAYLVENYGGRLLSTDELKKINSDEGYTVTFSTREDAVTYLGAICYNSEGSQSPVAVTSARSLKEPARTPTTSPLFESLKGEWHVKAPVQGSLYVNGVATEFKVNAEFDVTIGDVGYANTLPDYIYDLYYSVSNMNKNDVDAVYAQFKSSVDNFNLKNKNQNRLLVQGFDLAQPIESYSYKFDGEETSITAFRSPYQLFISEDYSGYNYESPVYDFGPKLYLEFDAEGNITVPFNVNYFAPAAQWFESVFHLVGCSDTSVLPYMTNNSGEPVTGHFPVEVSADGNTITIKGLLLNGSNYYPTLVAESYQQGGYSVPCSVFGDITMTRKATVVNVDVSVSNTTRSAFNKVSDVVPAALTSEYDVVPLAFKSRTALPAEVKAPQRVKMNIVTSEEFHKRADERSRQLGFRR